MPMLKLTTPKNVMHTLGKMKIQENRNGLTMVPREEGETIEMSTTSIENLYMHYDLEELKLKLEVLRTTADINIIVK